VTLAAVIAVMKLVEPEFLRVQAERCRKLAERADSFTRERLLRLAEDYDKRWEAETKKHPANDGGV
jgi:hypothetical protein